MPSRRHERRGSEIIAEHLAWANVISQSGYASHPGAHQKKKSQKVGNPKLAHLRFFHCPRC